MKNSKKIQVIESADSNQFTERVNELLNDGWKIKSTNCGFANSEKYDFCNVYQAILIKSISGKFSIGDKVIIAYPRESAMGLKGCEGIIKTSSRTLYHQRTYIVIFHNPHKNELEVDEFDEDELEMFDPVGEK